MRALRIAGLLAAAALVACQGDLPEATEIARMRVLGAQFSVAGDDPTRATPRPGETVRITLPTVFPSLQEEIDALPRVQAMIVGCTAPTRFTGGLPICQEFIDLALSGEIPETELPAELQGRQRCDRLPARSFSDGALSLRCVQGGPPTFELEVPEDFAAARMLIRGVVCERGAPFIDPSDPLLFGCVDENAEAIRVHGTVAVQHRDADANHNPDIDALTVRRIVGKPVPWQVFDPEAAPSETACADLVADDFSEPVHPIITGTNVIELGYAAAARERSGGEPEDLEITVYTTGGEVERRFTLFEGSADSPGGTLSSELEWKPPDNDMDGELVRLFITLRDQRGGFAMTTRAACVYGTATDE